MPSLLPATVPHAVTHVVVQMAHVVVKVWEHHWLADVWQGNVWKGAHNAEKGEIEWDNNVRKWQRKDSGSLTGRGMAGRRGWWSWCACSPVLYPGEKLWLTFWGISSSWRHWLPRSSAGWSGWPRGSLWGGRRTASLSCWPFVRHFFFLLVQDEKNKKLEKGNDDDVCCGWNGKWNCCPDRLYTDLMVGEESESFSSLSPPEAPPLHPPLTCTTRLSLSFILSQLNAAESTGGFSEGKREGQIDSCFPRCNHWQHHQTQGGCSRREWGRRKWKLIIYERKFTDWERERDREIWEGSLTGGPDLVYFHLIYHPPRHYWSKSAKHHFNLLMQRQKSLKIVFVVVRFVCWHEMFTCNIWTLLPTFGLLLPLLCPFSCLISWSDGEIRNRWREEEVSGWTSQ